MRPSGNIRPDGHRKLIEPLQRPTGAQSGIAFTSRVVSRTRQSIEQGATQLQILVLETLDRNSHVVTIKAAQGLLNDRVLRIAEPWNPRLGTSFLQGPHMPTQDRIPALLSGRAFVGEYDVFELRSCQIPLGSIKRRVRCAHALPRLASDRGVS